MERTSYQWLASPDILRFLIGTSLWSLSLSFDFLLFLLSDPCFAGGGRTTPFFRIILPYWLVSLQVRNREKKKSTQNKRQRRKFTPVLKLRLSMNLRLGGTTSISYASDFIEYVWPLSVLRMIFYKIRGNILDDWCVTTDTKILHIAAFMHSIFVSFSMPWGFTRFH